MQLDGLSQELMSGVSGGSAFRIVPHEGFPPLLVQGTPVIPGKTGMETCTINNLLAVQCSATQGADTAQHVMWLRLAALGAGKISNVILGPDAAAATEEQVKDYLSRPSAVRDDFNGVDVNHDGSLTPAEILSFAHSEGLVSNTALPPFLGPSTPERPFAPANSTSPPSPRSTLPPI